MTDHPERNELLPAAGPGPSIAADRTAYEILMVSPQATAEVIEVAYLIQAKALAQQPTANPEDRARLAEAYHAVRDPARRARYDANLVAQPSPGPRRGGGLVQRQRTCWA